MSDIKEIFSDIKESSQDKVNFDANLLLAEINFSLSFQNITSEDIGILNYNAGYVARSIRKREKCQLCCKLLINESGVPRIQVDEIRRGVEIDPVLLETRNEYLREINRGGLCEPSDLLFVATLHAKEFLDRMLEVEKLKKLLFASHNARSVFVRCFAQTIETNQNTKGIWEAKCADGHHMMRHINRIACAVFNMAAKNLASELNSKIHASRKRKEKESDKENEQAKQCAAKRKICKLQSSSL
jgi:hypothetical protein